MKKFLEFFQAMWFVITDKDEVWAVRYAVSLAGIAILGLLALAIYGICKLF